ncbi:RNA polymerase sigma factor [Algoriphagus yeomjeoni]|uniref:RNA polymerase sigma factor n=1 Tax=Algoriphagus yeomjeoni TaxID=291403 RepID=UPI003CE58B94
MGSPVNLFISRSQKTDLRTNSDDVALWQSVRKGNDLAFSNLYQRFSNVLFNYGMHFCYNSELVKDCIQELFTNIWNRRETLTEIDSVKHYLFTSFRNLLIQHINRNRKLFTDSNENDEFLDFDLSVEDELLAQDFRKENEKKIFNGLTKISKRQREILILKFFNDLSYAEIASIMSITPAAAHNLMSKALQCMRVALR